jgi:hypothetical protein
VGLGLTDLISTQITGFAGPAFNLTTFKVTRDI